MENMELYGQATGPVDLNIKAMEQAKSFIRWSSNPESIIDVGIGDGRVTNEAILPMLPENIKEYVGADLSTNALNFSKTTVTHPKYKTIQIDICSNELPIEYQNRFDKVFACFLLHMTALKVKYVCQISIIKRITKG